jgi:hypothetical protein
MIEAGVKGDNTAILPFTETQGTATNATSIYAVRFGEDPSDGGVTALVNTNEPLIQVRDLGEAHDKSALRTRIQWFVALGLFGSKAAARLGGVLNA